MGPNAAQQKLFLSRFTSRTSPSHTHVYFTCPAARTSVASAATIIVRISTLCGITYLRRRSPQGTNDGTLHTQG
eukprot:4460360-Prymnesium_polylepis.1